MKRTFDILQAKKWKNTICIQTPINFAACYRWLDKLESNGEYFVGPAHYNDDGALIRIYWFTDEADAMLFKLKYGT